MISSLHGKYKETVETVSDFILGGSKITADGDCSHEIKRCLHPGRKLMTKLESILKSRDMTLPTNVHLVKSIVFPVVMYGCNSWTVKKTEHHKIDAFKLWCWRRLLRVPWTARRSNQSILKEISPGYFGRNDANAEAPVLWPPHVKSWLIGKDSDAGKYWGQEEKGTTLDEMAGWHQWLDGHEFEWTLGIGDGQGVLLCCNSWGHGDLDTTQQLKWTELTDLTSMQSTSEEILGWMYHKLESRLGGEISITSYMKMTAPLWQKANN